MKTIESYVAGAWTKGIGNATPLYDSVKGEQIAEVFSDGLDFGAILDYGRNIGGIELRQMTFQERGLMLKALALHLHKKKDVFYDVSYATGATKIDSWIDIEGGIGNLFANASLRRKFPNEPFYLEGEAAPLSKNGTFIGHHLCVPKEGVAIHINAYNFPIWGMLEKIAVNLLAGVPAVVKPATVTCFLTEFMVREIIDSKILPEGVLQLVCGSARNMLDYVTHQDVVTFTGSASTGRMLKTHERIVEESVPFNMEADSLNCTVLGEDAAPGTKDFDIFVKELHKEMTVKCGQKCTAIRRTFVPEQYLDAVIEKLKERLDKTTIGDPRNENVRMGALAGSNQKREVLDQVNKLSAVQELVYGTMDSVEVLDANFDQGAFMSPLLFVNNKPFENTECHSIEPFGPVSTIIPYKKLEEAIDLSKMGKGSLCCSIVTSDSSIAKQFTLGAAPYHGRVLVLNESCAKESTGHGSPMPLLVHGGPGRAGGGEEMGGMRGVLHYMQRTAIQGHPTMITNIANSYQYGAEYIQKDVHVFRKHFEDLEVGETVLTHKRTITESDIINFANVSWDHFYAHTDATSLDGTIFEERVAHGYFILSAAAGLFVDPGKGPVLLNYGLEECRFIKPVYAGATIGVRFTVKEKIEQEKKDEDDIAKGIVKFLVDVYDETDESVAIATILTMVKKKNQL